MSKQIFGVLHLTISNFAKFGLSTQPQIPLVQGWYGLTMYITHGRAARLS